ncbi:MAG: hypothetical protein IGR76_12655 [Synechococcales cyanobacterium T60_A2020_003]|nr:hypothetical protein [Synechococcales cyanobacterium T60_A2020_003]
MMKRLIVSGISLLAVAGISASTASAVQYAPDQSTTVQYDRTYGPTHFTDGRYSRTYGSTRFNDGQ